MTGSCGAWHAGSCNGSLGTSDMDETRHTRSAGPAPVFDRADRGARSPRGGRLHHLVASLSGGLQAAYSAQEEDEVADHFASLIAQLDRGVPDAR